MSWEVMLMLYLAILAGLIAIGCPIAIALGITGLTGILLNHGMALLPTVGDILWNTANSFILVAIPMFILMGEVILQTGISRRFYQGLSTLLHRASGGLVYANILGCGMFSAICGSSVATALTMGQVAMPELERRGYHPRLTTGSLAAGGTLGILIPPSIPMIIYAVTVQASVIDLFIAGIVPGLILIGLFCAWVFLYVKLRPHHIPATSEQDLLDRRAILGALRDCLPLIVLIVAIIGSLYFGLVTPTEAGAFGTLIALLIGFGYRELRWDNVKAALVRAVGMTTAIFTIIVTGSILAFAIVDAGIARGVSHAVVAANLSPLTFFLLIVALYVVLGMFIEGIAMMLLTVPILYPAVVALNFDPVWFGVVLVVLIEVAALTPPMGLNLIAIQSVAPNTPLGTVIRGAFPYVVVMLLFLIGLYLFPQMALWLPQTMR